MKHKKLLLTFGAFFGSLFAFLAITNSSAFAATKTWDGGGSDNNFNTAANWSGDSVPSNGDDLVFDNSSLSSEDRTLTNNLSQASFASVTFQGNGTTGYIISGNALTITGSIGYSISGDFAFTTIETPLVLQGNSSINVPVSHNLFVTGNISGSGNITKAGGGDMLFDGDNSQYTGLITISAGSVRAGPKGFAGSGGTIIANGADVGLSPCAETELQAITANLTLSGESSLPSGDFPAAKITVYNGTCGGGGGGGGGFDETYGSPIFGDVTVEINGAIELTSDVTFTSFAKTTLIKAALSGNYKFNLFSGSSFSLVLQNSNSAMANGTYSSPLRVVELTNDLPTTSVGVYGNTTLVLTGKRGEINVGVGGKLKGTGVAGAVYVLEGGMIAPGLSPGTINTGNLIFSEGGIYEFEIGKDAADQIKVAGTVELGNGTLTPILFDGFRPAAGKSYIIIDNDGSDAVNGTFKNIAEGATFTKDGYVYGVSYKAGDGNDVSLTVRSVPASPDTGFGILTQNPLATLAVTLLATGAIAFAAKKYRPIAIRR